MLGKSSGGVSGCFAIAGGGGECSDIPLTVGIQGVL